jgi:phage terminase large subunit GpA-like protein
MCRDVRQETTLSAQEADLRPWLGVHFSQLYMSNKPLAFLAEKWIETLDDEASRRVFVNKRLGDVYEPKVRETKPDEWSRCVVVPASPDDCEAYMRGSVPPGVRFLTAGQDSRTIELHWCVWGWGLVRNKDGFPELGGWLIDYGTIKREHTPTIEAADLAVFDQVLYDRAFPRTDGSAGLYVTQVYHDSGWCPTAVYDYARRRPGRGFPVKGDADDSESSSPVVRWGAAPMWRGPDGREVTDPAMRLAVLNTYMLKQQLFGMLPRRIERDDGRVQSQLTLPRDVTDDWIAQSCSEVLVQEKRKQVYRTRAANHYSDCNIYAYAAALQLNPFQRGQTRDEAIEEAKATAARGQQARLGRGAAPPRYGSGGVRRSY